MICFAISIIFFYTHQIFCVQNLSNRLHTPNYIFYNHITFSLKINIHIVIGFGRACRFYLLNFWYFRSVLCFSVSLTKLDKKKYIHTHTSCIHTHMCQSKPKSTNLYYKPTIIMYRWQSSRDTCLVLYCTP